MLLQLIDSWSIGLRKSTFQIFPHFCCKLLAAISFEKRIQDPGPNHSTLANLGNVFWISGIAYGSINKADLVIGSECHAH